jgi:hypothetical protein
LLLKNIGTLCFKAVFKDVNPIVKEVATAVGDIASVTAAVVITIE